MNVHGPLSFTVTVRANHPRGSITEDEALAIIRRALSAEPMISVVSIASIKQRDNSSDTGEQSVRWG